MKTAGGCTDTAHIVYDSTGTAIADTVKGYGGTGTAVLLTEGQVLVQKSAVSWTRRRKRWRMCILTFREAADADAKMATRQIAMPCGDTMLMFDK